VRALLTRAPLEALALAALAAAVATFTLGNSSVYDWQFQALHYRWLTLAVLAVAAPLLAWARPRLVPLSPLVLALGGLLAALALVSAAWSPYPRLTLERGGTFVLVLVVAAALGVHAAARPAFQRAVAGTLVGVSAALAVAGFVRLAVNKDEALQGATADSPVRLQGIGMNPNTAALLYSLTIVLAVWLAFDARTRLGRALAGASAAVVGVSLFASGSRGATAASFLGIALYVALRGGSPARRALLVGATVVVYAGGISASNFRSLQPEFVKAVEPRVTVPLPSGAPTEQPLPAPVTGKELAPGVVLPNVGPYATRWRRAFPNVRPNYPYDAYQIGFERPDGVFQPTQSGIFRGSGRLSVWRGALDDVGKRPLLGFGFGLEEQVFVDRYYAFEGTRPENSYLGWLLQLGAAGTLLFAVLGAALLLLARRRPVSEAQAAFAGAVLAGLAVSLMQSWVYSVGNLATIPFWVTAGLLAGAAARPRPPVGRRRLARAGAGALVLLAVVAAAGRLERARWIDSERTAIHGVLAAVGGHYVSRSLSDIWDNQERPGISCLRYAANGDPYALQLCFDPRGRVTEAYDERSGRVEVHDLHEEPEESGLRLDPRELRQIRRYVVSTQTELRLAAEREKLRQALRKARAGRTS
jgi:hypothetical protein